MNHKTTKSGKYTIFHRDACPFAQEGVQIPMAFMDPAFSGPWFYMPSSGWKLPADRLKGYPSIYSQGFATPEDALTEAEEWEAGASLQNAMTFNL